MEPHATVLRCWGSLGEALSLHGQSRVSWEPVQRMIAAATQDAEGAEEDLRRLLKESSSRLSPLGDPLDSSLDFKTHRWLKLSREEAYSDWLAWILECQERTEEMLKLFKLPYESTLPGSVTITREFNTPQGRLDLLIELADRLTLVVEVKTDAEPDTDQLRRYLAWVRSRPGSLGVILLAPDPPEDSDLLDDARGCPWRRVAGVLRIWASRWLRDDRGIEAALTLAFCGAVEQNILGLEIQGLGSLATKRYIEECMEGADYAEN